MQPLLRFCELFRCVVEQIVSLFEVLTNMQQKAATKHTEMVICDFITAKIVNLSQRNGQLWRPALQGGRK